jgi:hypothetical protein
MRRLWLPKDLRRRLRRRRPGPHTRSCRKTGSELPLMALLASLSLAGGFGLRLARKTL